MKTFIIAMLIAAAAAASQAQTRDELMDEIHDNVVHPCVVDGIERVADPDLIDQYGGEFYDAGVQYYSPIAEGIFEMVRDVESLGARLIVYSLFAEFCYSAGKEYDASKTD